MNIKFTLLILIITILFGCSVKKKQHVIFHPSGVTRQFSKSGIAFKTYEEQFEKTGKKEKGDSFKVNNIPINFGTIDNSGFVGVCHVYYNQTKEIIIRKDKWSSYPEDQKRLLIFHELGHCALDRNHKDGMTPKDEMVPKRYESIESSIMNSKPGFHKKYAIYKDSYDTELFTSNSEKLQIAVQGIKIFSISPNYFHQNGGKKVTISGEKFSKDGVIKIGDKVCTDQKYITSSKIECKVPKIESNEFTKVDVKYLRNGKEMSRLIEGFTYIGKPSLWLDSSNKDSFNFVNGKEVSKWKSIPWDMTNGFNENGIGLSSEDKNRPYTEVQSTPLAGVQFNKTSISSLTGPQFNMILSDIENVVDFAAFVIFKSQKIDYDKSAFPFIFGSDDEKFGLGIKDSKIFLFINIDTNVPLIETPGLPLLKDEIQLATLGMYNGKLKLALNKSESVESESSNGLDGNKNIILGKGKSGEPFDGYIYELLIFKKSLEYEDLKMINSLLENKWAI